ncbi:hypothetical protein, partial [Bernardetia sp.]|uniref:hypothetical protein n=1 Tax=Bernardetia sp. TaxID=1937974 RepID=UPI0025C5F664
VWENRSTFASGSLGSAGGDLNGNYSNLQINPNAVTETELANSSVTTSKIQSTGNDLVLTTDATGNVMWENRNSFTTGSLGSAGGDLNGNYSNLQINPNAVTETELANSSVTTSKIQSTGNDLVLTTDATGNVVWENRNSFTAGSLGSAGGDLNGNYSNLQINPNAVTETEIANNAVTANKIQNGAVTDAKISSLDPSKLQQDGASNGQVLKWDGSSWSPANDNNFGGSGAISYYSIDPFDFKAGLSEGGDESKNNVIVFENYTQAVTIHKDNEGETISAAFHLPHGATVQSITVYYLDDRGGNIDFYVDRKAFGTATTVISSATSNENDNSVSTKVLGTSFVIDNQNYSYAFRAVFDVGGGDVDDVSDIEHAIYGVKIQYMIP